MLAVMFSKNIRKYILKCLHMHRTFWKEAQETDDDSYFQGGELGERRLGGGGAHIALHMLLPVLFDFKP